MVPTGCEQHRKSTAPENLTLDLTETYFKTYHDTEVQGHPRTALGTRCKFFLQNQDGRSTVR